MASAQAERYLASLPLEDQQAIRAGGDVDAWYNAAVAAGAVPQNFGGTAPVGDWANMTAEQAGINPWQQDYKQEFDRTTNQMLAQMSPEQRARWSMEHLDALDYRTRDSSFQQWLAWQRHFDPSCPSSAPYRAEDGSGCVEKPDNSNAGYQQGQEGGAGGGGGRRQGGQGQQGNLTSPLVDMLKNQGSFLGGYDPIRGDQNPGIRGGVSGGGAIWWQPTQQTQTTRGGEIRGTGTGPAGPYGGVMGGYNLPRDGSASTSVLGQRGGEIRSPASGPAGPYGGIMGGQNVPRLGGPLTNVMTGLQSQNRRFDPLGSMMTPYQRNRRTASSWFGG